MAALLYAAVPAPAHAEKALACWTPTPLLSLVQIYETEGFLAVIAAYFKMNLAAEGCWKTEISKNFRPIKILASSATVKNPTTGRQGGAIAMARYEAEPYRGKPYYVAYGN